MTTTKARRGAGPTKDRPARPTGRPTAPSRRRRRARQFIPPQHGAWAMLILPYLAGVVAAGFRWLDVPLFVAWLAGYLFSYYALQAVKTRRPARVKTQLWLYGSIAAVFGSLVVALRPEVLWLAPVYVGLLVINVAYSWRRRDRALANGLASVVQSCLMVFVTAIIADVPLSEVVAVFIVVLAYFTGTVFFVKTMIRERDSAIYRHISIAFHAAAMALAAWLSIPLGVLFAALLVRAWVMPRGSYTAKQAGILEIVNSVLLFILLFTV